MKRLFSSRRRPEQQCAAVALHTVSFLGTGTKTGHNFSVIDHENSISTGTGSWGLGIRYEEYSIPDVVPVVPVPVTT